jgi:hypothetical protein
MSDVSERVYIHELVDITGHNRARYMHHITANWGPIGREERGQLCFGVFGTVGSTGSWPEVVNIWEYADWDALADNFDHELSHPTLQDPALADWWAAAEGFRRGGSDRILVAAQWMRSIEQLCADGVTGATYAHEIVRVRPGTAPAYLDAVRDVGVGAYGAHGLEPVGAWRTAMVGDAEVLLLWAVPDWRTWGRFELAQATAPELVGWTRVGRPFVERSVRFLVVDAPLSPLRTGRQPQITDRTLHP